MKFIIKEETKIVQFIELFKFMKNLSQYVTLNCTEERINIQILDESHVSLLDIKFKGEWFSEYIFIKNETFSINNNVFNKLLHLYTIGSTLECCLNDDKFDVSFLHSMQNKYFTIHLIDIEKDILSSENETDLDFSIKTKLLDKYINDIATFGEEIEISCKNDKLYLSSNNEEGKITIEIENKNMDSFNVVDDYNASFKFCLKYIQYITKLKIVFDVTHIYLNENLPIMITFDNIDIEIKYYIAPKINEDD